MTATRRRSPPCDRELTARTDAAQMVPGAAWAEGAAGTNGLGLALALGRPAQVRGPEHFCAGWHPYSCTASPIRHPVTGELLGALVVTTPAGVHDTRVVRALSARTAAEIEHGLGARVLGPERTLIGAHVRAGRRSGRPQLSVDEAGTLLIENPAAAQALDVGDRERVLDLAGRALELTGELVEEVPLSAGSALVTVTLVRWEGEVIGAIATVDGPSRAEPRPARTLREIEREAIVRRLEEAAGDVDAAAESLGISRATLYRRLRTYRALGLLDDRGSR